MAGASQRLIDSSIESVKSDDENNDYGNSFLSPPPTERLRTTGEVIEREIRRRSRNETDDFEHQIRRHSRHEANDFDHNNLGGSSPDYPITITSRMRKTSSVHPHHNHNHPHFDSSFDASYVGFSGTRDRRSYSTHQQHGHNGNLTRVNSSPALFPSSTSSTTVVGGVAAITRSSATPHMKDRIRRKLRYYFMNPIDKWRAKGRLPWKLGLQVIKIVFVTLQLIIFGYDMQRFLTHQGNMAITFREMMLKDWDPIREITAYPPAAGPYAVYERDDFYDHVNYAIRTFANITEMSIGSFGYATNTSVKEMSPAFFCKRFYATGIVKPSDSFYTYDNTIKDDCVLIDNLYPPGNRSWETDFDIRKFLNSCNSSVYFDRLMDVRLLFPIRTIYLNSLDRYEAPECYDVNVTILYDNTLHDGQMLISLSTIHKKRECHGNLEDKNGDSRNNMMRQALNWLVIFLCFSSFALCFRSAIKGQKLRQEAVFFFRKNFGKELSFQEKLDFIDFWIVTIIINDAMIIAASALKLRMEQQLIEDNHYNACSILLGVGNLLVWAGLLRYLQMNKKYNILILTLKRSLPHVLRFLSCAILLYGGFCFCAWVVLGPYHYKFQKLSTTSECLFALMNGDDMFATFTILDTSDATIWWFSRIYIYTFVVLFIYVILSLFISIIMDAYETIKEYNAHGFPLSDLQSFIAECTDESTSRVYMDDQDTNFTVTSLLSSWRRWWRRRLPPYSTI